MKAESRYRHFDPDNQIYPELTDVYRYWQQKQGGRFAPPWTDINLLDIAPAVIPRICVVDVNADRSEFTYRFWGTAITDMHHYDLSGKSVLVLKPAHYAKTIYRQYQTVFETAKPQGFLTEVPFEADHYTYYAVIRMPLSSNGKDVDMIMSVEDYGDDRDQLRKVFDKAIQDQSI